MDGMRRFVELVSATVEVSLLLGLALVGLALLPLFCLSQAIKGDPWWFWPRYAKTPPPPRRGGFWDHP